MQGLGRRQQSRKCDPFPQCLGKASSSPVKWPALTYPQCPPSPDHSCLGAHPLCYPACRPLPRHRSFYLWPIHSFPITQHSFSHSLRFISSTLLCPFLPVHFHHPSGHSLIMSCLGIFYLLAIYPLHPHSLFLLISLPLAHSFRYITHFPLYP